jgi:hypothetical protein
MKSPRSGGSIRTPKSDAGITNFRVEQPREQIMNKRDRTTKRSASRGPLRLVLISGLAMTAVAACGDSDEESAQETYCEAAESLDASVDALLDLDLVAEGTDGLESALVAVDNDLSDLSDSATEAAADDVNALQQSVDAVEGALSGLGAEISSENVAGLQSAIQSVDAAAQALTDTLSDC